MIELHPEHARAILAEVAVGLVLVDRQERVTWVNAHAAGLLGHEADALRGRAVTTLGVPYARPADDATEASARVAGSLVGFTQAFRPASGGGWLIVFYERGHALVGFLAALAGGFTGGLAASGVLSHDAIKGRLESEMSRSRRYANPLSCISVSLPAVGETGAVAEVARALREQLRWVDLLGHWHHDSLVVVLPETAADAADKLARKLRQALDTAAPGGHGRLLIGQASWRRGDNPERLVRRAQGTARRAAPVRLAAVATARR